MIEGSVKLKDSSFKKEPIWKTGEKQPVSSIQSSLLKGKERAENIFEEIMAKNFSYLLLKQIYKVEKLSKPQAGKILIRLHLGTSDCWNR